MRGRRFNAGRGGDNHSKVSAMASSAKVSLSGGEGGGRNAFSFYWAMLSFVVCLVHFRLAHNEGSLSPIVVQTWNIVTWHATAPFHYRLLTPLALFTLESHLPFKANAIAFFFHLFVFFALFSYFFDYLTKWFTPAESALGVMMLAFCVIVAATESGPMRSLIFQGDSFRGPWDITSTLFYAALAGSLVERNAPAWYFAFALGTLNKETTAAFVPAVFFMWRDRPYRHVLATAAIYAAIKFFLWHLYGESPLAERVTVDNLAMLLSRDVEVYVVFAMTFCGAWVFLFHGLKRCARELRVLFLSVAPVFCLIALWRGRIIEIRLFTELAVVVVPVALAGMRLRAAIGITDDPTLSQ